MKARLRMKRGLHIQTESLQGCKKELPVGEKNVTDFHIYSSPVNMVRIHLL